MELITATKKELTEAMRQGNLNYLENPNNYGSIDNTTECAERQLDNVLNNVTDGHMQETLAGIRTETVSQFMEHCKDNGIDVPETLFESFFGA